MKQKVEVYIPAPLRPYVGNADKVSLEAETVGDAIRALVERYPQLRTQLLDEQGRVRRHVNVFLNDRNVNELGGLEVRVRENDRILLLPAIAGGLAIRSSP
ncbi:MAG: ubiquitin-like small modifier protein 1 [Nitrososphaerota archaeon]